MPSSSGDCIIEQHLNVAIATKHNYSENHSHSVEHVSGVHFYARGDCFIYHLEFEFGVPQLIVL